MTRAMKSAAGLKEEDEPQGREKLGSQCGVQERGHMA